MSKKNLIKIYDFENNFFRNGQSGTLMGKGFKQIGNYANSNNLTVGQYGNRAIAKNPKGYIGGGHFYGHQGDNFQIKQGDMYTRFIRPDAGIGNGFLEFRIGASSVGRNAPIIGKTLSDYSNGGNSDLVSFLHFDLPELRADSFSFDYNLVDESFLSGSKAKKMGWFVPPKATVYWDSNEGRKKRVISPGTGNIKIPLDINVAPNVQFELTGDIPTSRAGSIGVTSLRMTVDNVSYWSESKGTSKFEIKRQKKPLRVLPVG